MMKLVAEEAVSIEMKEVGQFTIVGLRPCHALCLRLTHWKLAHTVIILYISIIAYYK